MDLEECDSLSDSSEEVPNEQQGAIEEDRNDVDLDNNDLNYDDSDNAPVNSPLIITRATKNNMDEINEATMISSSEDEYETSAEQNSNIRNSACSITLENLEDQNKSVLKPSTPQKDVEAEDLEEGEILSDTDEDIPEMEGGISPKDSAKETKYSPIVFTPIPSVRVSLNRVEATCKFFLRGSCTWGDSCKFYHPKEKQEVYRPCVSNQTTFLLTPNKQLILPLNQQPIFPPYTMAPPPLPLLSVFTGIPPPMPPPLPPPLPQPLITGENTSAWERGFRQARELLKKSSPIKTRGPVEGKNWLIETELIPIDSPEESRESTVSPPLKSNNISSEAGLASRNAADRDSSSHSPELITSLPDDPSPLKMDNLDPSGPSQSNNRGALGSDSFSDPWARNMRRQEQYSHNHKSHHSTSNSSNESHRSQIKGRERSVSTSSSHPTIPEDSERFDDKHGRDTTQKRRYGSSPSTNSRRKRSRANSSSHYFRDKRSHDGQHSGSSRAVVDSGRRKTDSHLFKDSTTAHSQSRSPLRNRYDYKRTGRYIRHRERCRNSNDVERFFAHNEDDVPAVYRLNRTSTSPKEHNRGRSSSSDSSSASSCSSKRHRSVSKRSESDQISPNGTCHINGKCSIMDVNLLKADQANLSDDLNEELGSSKSFVDKMLEDPVNLVNEQKDPCSFPFEVINPPATSINDSIGMSELYAQLRINLADEKTRKREELLLELKSVEEAIARATHKVRN